MEKRYWACKKCGRPLATSLDKDGLDVHGFKGQDVVAPIVGEVYSICDNKVNGVRCDFRNEYINENVRDVVHDRLDEEANDYAHGDY